MNIEILTSLTSTGLIRRATKALDKSSPIFNEMQFEFEDQKGTIDWLKPDNSKCDCTASGMCKHILAAYLYLLNQQDETNNSDSAKPHNSEQNPSNKDGSEPSDRQNTSDHNSDIENKTETIKIADVNIERILKSAGKVKIKQTHRQIARLAPDQIQISYQGGIATIQVEQYKLFLNMQQPLVHLDNLVCTQEDRRYDLLAIYFYCQAQAIEFTWPDWLEEENQLARQQRNDLVTKGIDFIEKLTEIGIDGLRMTSLAEIDPLLVLMSRSYIPTSSFSQLKGNLEKYITGEGIRDRKQVLLNMANSLAYLEPYLLEPDSSESGDINNVGNEQTINQPPKLLLCIGGYPWKASGGAHGMTMVFQDDKGTFTTVSDSRANASQTLSYSSLWHSSEMLEGAPSGSAWLGNTMMIVDANLNPWGRIRRLSSTHVRHADEKLALVTTSKISEIDWQQEFVCFSPTQFYTNSFNDATQCMELFYLDEHQRSICFSLPYSDLNKQAISNMEKISGILPQTIVARIERTTTRLELRPISYQYKECWSNFHFQHFQSKINQQLMDRWLDKIADRPIVSEKPTSLQQVLLMILDDLADKGAKPRHKLAELCQSLGLRTLSYYLERGTGLDYLRAAYCANQMLTLSLTMPIDAPLDTNEYEDEDGDGDGDGDGQE